MRTRFFFNFLLITFVVISCNSFDLPAGTPQVIEDKIKLFEKEHICDQIQVNRYDLNGEKYYCFLENCCCDIGSNWYDSGGKLVCISGTIAGNVNCIVPIDSMDFEAVIWSN